MQLNQIRKNAKNKTQSRFYVFLNIEAEQFNINKTLYESALI